MLLVVSCKQPNQDKLDELVERGNFEKTELIENIKSKVLDTTYMKGFRFNDTLTYFYKYHNFKPVWAMYMVNDSMAKPILDRLFQSREEGLKPSYKEFDPRNSMWDGLKTGRSKSQ